MNNLLKCFFTGAMILLLGGWVAQTYAQRCGGSLEYIVRNHDGKIVDADKVRVKHVRTLFARDEEPVDQSYRTEWARDSIIPLWIRTACGMYLIEVTLEHEGRTMRLRFHNVPMETNFFVDSVPFQEGTYEIDFKGEMSLKSQRLNREGVRSTGGKYLLRTTAEAGLVVSAENWIRFEPSP